MFAVAALKEEGGGGGSNQSTVLQRIPDAQDGAAAWEQHL